MTYRFVDCMGFAGGFTLGAVQAGMELVGKREMKGYFGGANCEANRDLLGDGWKGEAVDAEDWTIVEAEAVLGNPPCSGFSLLSNKNFRGMDSEINHCMWAFAGYTARVMPQVAVFESVQQAYTGGLPLMRNLRAKLEDDTGKRWDLHHVLHNAYSIGGAAIRRRYFWVVSRVPFGVDAPVITRLPCVDDVIGDLEGLGRSWGKQPYRRPASWWSTSRRSPSGVTDGHWSILTPAAQRALALIDGTPWQQREIISQVTRRYVQLYGRLPGNWPEHKLQQLLESDFKMGYNQMVRWHGHYPCRVITGGGMDLTMHPHENRLLSHREVARIQGFPDDWKIEPLRGVSGLRMTWGKGIPTDCGRWIAGWVIKALDGRPGAEGRATGEVDREFVHDCTNAFRSLYGERGPVKVVPTAA